MFDMGGRYVRQIWKYDPSVYAPPRYRRACAYDAFVPESVAGFDRALPVALTGVVSDAESAIRSLNERARPA